LAKYRTLPVLQAEASACKTNTTQNQPHQISNTQRTENKTTDVVSTTAACKTNTTQNQPQKISNTQRTENKTTDVIIQQHSH
jgi:hypothetical protein